MFATIFAFFIYIIKLLFISALMLSFLFSFMLFIDKRLKQLNDEVNHQKINWKFFIYIFLIETLGHFYGMIVFPFAKIYEAQEVAPSKNPMTPPILLIHGSLRTALDFLWFKQNLQAIDGLGSVFTMNLFPWQKNIATHAKCVSNKVEEIKAKTGSDQIILIGHSRGGLVASYYCEFLADKKTISSVISIGTPFNGTKTVVLGYQFPVKEMAPHAQNLAPINEHIAVSKIPYYHIASKMDEVVIPWHSACPWKHQNKTNVLILEDLGHLQLLISHKVIHQIAKWLLKDNIDL